MTDIFYHIVVVMIYSSSVLLDFVQFFNNIKPALETFLVALDTDYYMYVFYRPM